MGFEQVHPAILFLYFAAVTADVWVFRHPVFLGISLAGAAAYSIRLHGKKAAAADLALLILAVVFAFAYSVSHHFGVTVLHTNFIGNHITLEAFVYGLMLGLTAACFLIWMSCVCSVFTTDKAVSLIGRVHPSSGLFLAMTLRIGPRLAREAGDMGETRTAIGRGLRQGNALRRCRNGIAVLSMLISWLAEALRTGTDSMRARGSTVRGRTAFAGISPDGRDRILLTLLTILLTLTAMGAILGQTWMSYSPRLVRITPGPATYVFYAAYLLLCLLPLLVDLLTACVFRACRRRGGKRDNS